MFLIISEIYLFLFRTHFLGRSLINMFMEYILKKRQITGEFFFVVFLELWGFGPQILN